jgi:ADP-heptose:LPS heptosyltransferase
MGLSVPPDTASMVNNQSMDKKIALICCSENSPQKRWSVKRWSKLVDLLLKKFGKH